MSKISRENDCAQHLSETKYLLITTHFGCLQFHKRIEQEAFVKSSLKMKKKEPLTTEASEMYPHGKTCITVAKAA